MVDGYFLHVAARHVWKASGRISYAVYCQPPLFLPSDTCYILTDFSSQSVDICHILRISDLKAAFKPSFIWELFEIQASHMGVKPSYSCPVLRELLSAARWNRWTSRVLYPQSAA